LNVGCGEQHTIRHHVFVGLADHQRHATLIKRRIGRRCRRCGGDEWKIGNCASAWRRCHHACGDNAGDAHGDEWFAGTAFEWRIFDRDTHRPICVLPDRVDHEFVLFVRLARFRLEAVDHLIHFGQAHRHNVSLCEHQHGLTYGVRRQREFGQPAFRLNSTACGDNLVLADAHRHRLRARFEDARGVAIGRIRVTAWSFVA
jgi:hypothetical protein